MGKESNSVGGLRNVTPEEIWRDQLAKPVTPEEIWQDQLAKPVTADELRVNQQLIADVKAKIRDPKQSAQKADNERLLSTLERSQRELVARFESEAGSTPKPK